MSKIKNIVKQNIHFIFIIFFLKHDNIQELQELQVNKGSHTIMVMKIGQRSGVQFIHNGFNRSMSKVGLLGQK